MILPVLLGACGGIENTERDWLLLDLMLPVSYVEEGAEVADISAIERDGRAVGYAFSFSDGHALTVLDGQEGLAVTGFSEDSANYYFEIKDEGRVTLPKAQPAEPFSVEISGDEAEIADGGTVTASYKVSGAGKGLEITVMTGAGWTAEVTESSDSEGTVKVTAPNPITTDKVLVSFKDASGRQVVKALRLTSKSLVKRGNIETYAYSGVVIKNADPSLVGMETALRRYGYVAEAGVQIMEVSARVPWEHVDWHEDALMCLDLAEQVGIKLSLDVGNMIFYDDLMKSFVAAVKDHPALWGYMVYDEPDAGYYDALLRTRQVIESVDNKHICYVNLNGDGGTFGPVGSYLTDDYEEYLVRFAEETEPDLISFDVYPCFPDWVLDQIYTSLEQVADISMRYDLPFWAYVASCRFSDGLGIRISPTVESLRLQDYTILAYGGDGIEYFTWSADGDAAHNFGDWPTDPNGDINTSNPTFEYLQTVNQEIQNRAFVFDGCVLQWAAYHRNVPPKCKALDNSQLPGEILSFSSDADLLLTLIENDGGTSEYLNIVSRTHYKSNKVHLRFRYPVQTVERDGSLKTYIPGDYDFTIEPGDILIIKTR